MSLRRNWNREQICHAADWIAARNAQGSCIFIRPAQALESHPWILADDLSHATLERLPQSGYPAGIVVKTSPRLFQAWFRLPEPLPPQERLAIARAIVRIHAADPGGIGSSQFGRLPGTTNRKPEHRFSSSLFPFAFLHHAGPDVAPRLLALEARPPTPARTKGAGETSRSHDQSRIDFALACHTAIEHAILNHCPDDKAVRGPTTSAARQRTAT